MADVTSLVLPALEVEGRPFEVLDYDLTEAVSTISELVCEVTEQDREPCPPGDLIGKDAELRLVRTMGDAERSFYGRVVEARRAPDADGVRRLNLRIATLPWALSQRSDCRAWFDPAGKSAQDIAVAVLEAAGIDSGQQEWQLAEPHPPRTYVVQYRERDLPFMLRVLSEEGIYFTTQHGDGGPKLLFSDDPRGMGDAAPATLSYRAEHGFEEALDVATRLKQVHRVRTDKVTLRDRDIDRPQLDVTGEAESEDPGEHGLERYDYPARCHEPDEATRLAQIALEQFQMGRQRVAGDTGSLGLAVGLRVTIEEHPYAPMNQEYVITSLRIRGRGPRLGQRGDEDFGYRATFEAVPTAACKLRPEHVRRQGAAPSLSTARTTGAGGEEVHVDERAAVKIRYPWDRLGPEDDKSSEWFRTSQLALGDSMLLPRMDWEVSVLHLDGDPDRGIVMGRLYDATHPPPYRLPDEATKSSLQTATSPGGGSVNEMRLGDGKGAEQMLFNASKDMSVEVKNNTTESIGANLSRTVGNDQTQTITNSATCTVGGCQTIDVGADQSIKVETRLQDEVGGDHSLAIGGNRDLKVGGDHKREVAGSASLTVDGMMADLVVGSCTEETLSNYNHDVGAAIVDITAANRLITVGKNITETTGAAKVIAVKGGRGMTISGTFTQQVVGAIANVASGDKVESAAATYTEIAAGAQMVKANNITIEADGMLTLVMGASMINMNPAMITVMGVSIKLDGKTSDLGALIVDN